MNSRGRPDGTKKSRMFGRQRERWEGMAAFKDGGTKWNRGATASWIRSTGNKIAIRDNKYRTRPTLQNLQLRPTEINTSLLSRITVDRLELSSLSLSRTSTQIAFRPLWTRKLTCSRSLRL